LYSKTVFGFHDKKVVFFADSPRHAAANRRWLRGEPHAGNGLMVSLAPNKKLTIEATMAVFHLFTLN
jgi:hypothetical protein